ncbi:hypothetical protein ACFV9G_06995 [Nocardioides sp. NPDC059952]|uniref:hypothetical protein n=1 Tax=Nocardioides sp. NPDC059952 TaxID=3347014 RepID=UPI00364778F3
MRKLQMCSMIAALVAALSGCGSAVPDFEDGGEPPDPSPSAAAPAVDFSADIAVDPDSVTVTYTVTNNESTDVFVADRTLVPSGAGTKLSTAPYVTTENGEDGPVLVLSHRAFPWPPGINLAVAPTGGGQLLAPGETVTVETGIDLPATRNQPFGDDLGHGTITLPEDPVAVRFCLGVTASPIPPALQTQDAGEGALTFAHGNAAHEAQHLFCSRTEPLATDPARG